MSLTFEEYIQAITNIGTQLDDIARRTEGQAWLGKANFSNPDFVALMQRHTQLTKRSSELTDRMVNMMKE